MKGKLSAAGSVVAAVLASSCCWVPLLLAGLGAGGAGFASALTPYRAYLIGLTVVFLTGAWYFTLRRSPAVNSQPGDDCCTRETCCAPSAGRRPRVLALAGVTAFTVTMLAFPRLMSIATDDQPFFAVAGTPASKAATVVVRVGGMTCEACVAHIRDAVRAVPGVVAAEIDLGSGSVRVRLQRGKVSVEQVEQAITKAGYRVLPTRTVIPPNR